jgi:hypothetical protein
MENGGERMDKKQSLPVKIKIILYVDQISWGREPSDQCKKSTPKKKKKKKEQKRLGLSVNDEDRKRERERVRRLELHFRQNFRCGTDLVSSLKRREREREREPRVHKKREKKRKKEKGKKRSILRCDL